MKVSATQSKCPHYKDDKRFHQPHSSIKDILGVSGSLPFRSLQSDILEHKTPIAIRRAIMAECNETYSFSVCKIFTYVHTLYVKILCYTLNVRHTHLLSSSVNTVTVLLLSPTPATVLASTYTEYSVYFIRPVTSTSTSVPVASIVSAELSFELSPSLVV